MSRNTKRIGIAIVILIIGAVVAMAGYQAIVYKTTGGPGYSEIYTLFREDINIPVSQTEIINMTVNLPVDSYVVATASGYYFGSGELYIGLDNTQNNPDWKYSVSGPFSINSVGYLKAGKHTFHLNGNGQIEALKMTIQASKYGSFDSQYGDRWD